MDAQISDEALDRILVAAALIRGFIDEADLAQLLRQRTDQVAQFLVDAGRLSVGELEDFIARVRQRLADEKEDDGVPLARRLPEQAAERAKQPVVIAYLRGTQPPNALRSASTRYELTDVRGQGGVGRIWRAVDVALGREVALKEMRPEAAKSAELRGKFAREAAITSRLSHPNIVPIFQFGAAPGNESFYVMPLLRGRTLRDEIAELRPQGAKQRVDRMKLRRLLDIFLDVCNAIAFAHSRQIVHRDLKPDNIMVGEFGRVFVLDWGFAKEIDSTIAEVPDDSESLDATSLEETKAGTVFGSPMYMAPEQALGQPQLVGPAADIYALGGVLFQILTGMPPRSPTPHETRDAFLLRIRRQQAPAPRSFAPSVPLSLDAVCRHAMELDPGERYETVQEIADDVRRWLDDAEVSVAPDNVRRRFARWTRRHGPLAKGMFGGLFAAAITIGCMITYVLQDNQHHIANHSALIKARAEQLDRQLRKEMQMRGDDARELWEIVARLLDRRGPIAEPNGATAIQEMLNDYLVLQRSVEAAAIYFAESGKLAVFANRSPARNVVIPVETFVRADIAELRARAASDVSQIRYGKLASNADSKRIDFPVALARLPPGGKSELVLLLIFDFGKIFDQVCALTREFHYSIDCFAPDGTLLTSAKGDQIAVLPPYDGSRDDLLRLARESDHPVVAWARNDGELWTGRKVEIPNGQELVVLVSINYEATVKRQLESDRRSAIGGGATVLLVGSFVFIGALLFRGADD